MGGTRAPGIRTWFSMEIGASICIKRITSVIDSIYMYVRVDSSTSNELVAIVHFYVYV